MYVDSHSHLFFPNFDGETDEIIERAKIAGVEYIIVPATDISSSLKAVELANKYDPVYAAIGIHPHDTSEWNDSFIEDLESLAANKKVVAIGEIGLDYYYDFSPRDIQLTAFEKQIELALKLNLPIIVHNRQANDDIMDFARKYKDSGLRAQYHCFAGSIEDAKELVSLRHYISFTGNVTFKKADNIRKVLSSIQIDNMLLETDAPFMTPEPYRGKRNEPSYIPLIAEKIAEVQNLSIDDIARATSYSAYKLFGIGEKPQLKFTYKLGNSLYINITNRCNADCVFCDRKGEAVVKGHSLKMKKSEEPPAETYIKEMGDPKKYDEIVFCGFGEPTIRWEVVKEISKYVKDNGGKTRLNTDGHGNFINKRDITPELKGLIDTVSISLNSVDPEQYGKLMRVDPKMHSEMIDFIKKAKQYSKIQLTIVGLNEVDSERARKLATYELGVEFRERKYF